MRKKIYFLAALFSMLLGKAQLDSSFGTNGKMIFTNLGEIYSTNILPNGKIILAGTLNNQAVVYQLNSDGSFDTTFGTSGKVTLDDTNYSWDAAAYPVSQQDGKIILAYGVSNNNGDNVYEKLIRLNTNGTLDNSFNNSYGGLDQFFTEPIIQNDGKILIAETNRVHRFNADGSYDIEFGLSGVATLSGVNEIVYLNYNNNNGDIFYTDKQLTNDYSVRKLNSYGYAISTDFNVFTNTTIINSNFHQNNLYYSGYESQSSTQLYKLTPSLQYASDFGNSGIVDVPTTLDPNAMFNEGFIFLPDSKIIQTNFAYINSDIELVKFNANGSIDSTFGTNGRFIYNNSELVDTEFNYTKYNATNDRLYVISTDVENQKIVIARINTELLATKDVHKSTLKLYPNPAKSQLNFSEELSEIIIVDMSGKVISTQKEKTKAINVEKLPRGNYLISAKDKNGKIISEKFIKE